MLHRVALACEAVGRIDVQMEAATRGDSYSETPRGFARCRIEMQDEMFYLRKFAVNTSLHWDLWDDTARRNVAGVDLVPGWGKRMAVVAYLTEASAGRMNCTTAKPIEGRCQQALADMTASVSD